MREAWREWTPLLHLRRALKTSHDADALSRVVTHLLRTTGADRETSTKLAIAAAVTGDLGATCTLISRHLEGSPLHDVNTARFARTRPLRAERAAQALRTYAEMARTAGGFIPLIAEQLTGEDDDFRAVTTLFASARSATTNTGRTIARLLVDTGLWHWPTTAPGCATGLPPAAHAGLSRIAPASTRDTGVLFSCLVADIAETEGHNLGQGLDPHGVADTLAALQRLHAGTYYIGLTIDQMQADLIRAPRTTLSDAAWTARAAVLPHRYLGERGGWYGPSTGRKKVYQHSGHLIIRRTPA